MKYLIKYLLRFHRETILTEIVGDYFNDIPKKVSDEAVTILEEKRQRVDKWVAFQAFHLQRRVVHDPAKAQVIFGMLLQLKLMSHMISGGKSIPDEVEGTQPASSAQAEREKQEALDKAMQGVAAFGKKK